MKCSRVAKIISARSAGGHKYVCRNCRRNNKIRAHAYETTLSIQLSRSLPAIFIWKLQSLLSSSSSPVEDFLPRKNLHKKKGKSLRLLKRGKNVGAEENFRQGFFGGDKVFLSSLYLVCSSHQQLLILIVFFAIHGAPVFGGTKRWSFQGGVAVEGRCGFWIFNESKFVVLSGR